MRAEGVALVSQWTACRMKCAVQGCPSEEEVDAASGRMSQTYRRLFESLSQLPTESERAHLLTLR